MNLSDNHFIDQISYRLERFKKSNKEYNFRCPFCGDSQKSKHKARGWFFEHKGQTFFKCFNCGESGSFRHFLKLFDIDLYRKYLFENQLAHSDYKMMPDSHKSSEYITIKDFENNAYVTSCMQTNPAQLYLRKRKISKFNLFYYTPNYGKLLESLNLEKYSSEFKYSEEMLLIPHFDRNGHLCYLQMRSLDPNSKLRYKTYKVIESVKVWNLNNINLNNKIYICEGALDASFFDNGIAMSGAEADISETIINNYKENVRFILDNEPYNKEICKRYKKLQETGWKVFIWPDVEEKDINEYFLKNNNIDVFLDESNYYFGLRLKIELGTWIKNKN